MKNFVILDALKKTAAEYPEHDRLGIDWRTKFGIEHGLEPLEAYDLALASVGLVRS